MEFKRMIQDQETSINSIRIVNIITNKKLWNKIKQLQKQFPLRN